MFALLLSHLRHCAVPFFARSAGVYSSNPGSGSPPEGFGAVVIASLLGAFCGLIAGFLVAHILRYISFLVGRNMGGYSWVLVGLVVGAVAFGLAEILGRDN